MNKKLIVVLAAVIVVCFSATVVLALSISGKAKEEPVNTGMDEIVSEEGTAENEGSISGAGNLSEENKTEPKNDYNYLRGTLYKNLYRTKYSNLAETFEKEETISGEIGQGEGGSGSSGGGYSQVGVGSAADPGYSGSVGKYSLNDKTIAAHLSVQGTSIQNKAVWQCATSTTYYEPSNVAWAAKTAHLRSGSLSQNTVIYGHNWNNCFAPFKKTGSQFEPLMAYTYADFVAENQYIYLTTNSGVHTFKVFAVCFTKDLNFYINCNNINVASVAARAKSMSLFDFGVSVGNSDKIITLSTCTRYYSGLGANQRFIIMGKLVSTE